MMRRLAKRTNNDWVSSQLQGRVHSVAADDRRAGSERRRRVWWSVLYGSFNPRRRRPSRRVNDTRFHFIDWHASHLLAAAIGILMLSVTDAFMTVTLLADGAIEVNPIMASVIYRSVALFAAVKMAMTGVSVVFLVFLARYRLMRRIRVEWVLYGVLVGYGSLIGYEVWLLGGLGALPFL